MTNFMGGTHVEAVRRHVQADVKDVRHSRNSAICTSAKATEADIDGA